MLRNFLILLFALKNINNLKSITAVELQNKIQHANEYYLLIDGSEDFEHDYFNMGGSLMSLGNLLYN